MLRFANLISLPVGISILAMALSAGAFSQDKAVSPDSSTADQAKKTTAEDAPAKTQDGITDADRIIRLETSIEPNKKQLGELEKQLQKMQAEEGDLNTAVQQLTNQLDDAKNLLEKARDSGDLPEAEKQQTRLTELEPKHKLATEQFNLAIEARKTIQEQIATLQEKIAKDQASLDKLKGVTLPEPKDAEESTPTVSSASGKSDSPPDSQEEKSAESTANVKTESKEVVISKELSKAREVVQDKAKLLKEIEQDLASLAESKSLLEKSIELESKRLESTRGKYDRLENAMEIAEKEFNDKLAGGTPAGELQQLRAQVSGIQQRLSDTRGEIRGSTNRLQETRNQLLALQAEETQLVKQSEELRHQVTVAQRSESVLKVRDYLYTTVPKVVVILLLTFVLWMLVKLICRRSRAWIAHSGSGSVDERQYRAETLAGVFENTGNVVIIIGSGLMILDAAGVPITALLGGAGVVGLAVAFGAQSLIKDYFCGFILLLEGQYKVNDTVTIGGQTGVVERITLRITVLRDFEGKVFFIPNGQITSVTNATMDWSRAVWEVGVAYSENIDQVIEELKRLTIQLREDPAYSEAILGDVEMLGVDNLGDSAVVIKFGMKTRPDRKWPVKRELLRRIKNTFDEREIEIPFPHRTVIYRGENGCPASLVAGSVAKNADNI